MRAGLYVRVSTTDRGQDPEVQLRELRAFCEKREWNIEIYPDTGWSGAKERRPELDRLWEDCRRGKRDPLKLDVVVVYRFDRFARSVKQLVNALSEFNQLGIQFVSLHESLDSTTPNGRLLFHVFAAIAEFERDLTRERVKSGLALARSRGKQIGRPSVDVNVELVASLRRSGASWPTIAKQVGVSRASCQRALKSHRVPFSGQSESRPETHVEAGS